jgi:hypothetical protein
MAIWTTHGTADALEPARVVEPDDLSGKTEMMLLVPEWARDRLTFHYVKDLASPVFTVAMRENPVIEYTPCIMLRDESCVGSAGCTGPMAASSRGRKNAR